MKDRIKGWLGTVEHLEIFYTVVKQLEQDLGRPLFQQEREDIADEVFTKKLPYERLEAYLQGKKILYVKPKEDTNG